MDLARRLPTFLWIAGASFAAGAMLAALLR